MPDGTPLCFRTHKRREASWSACGSTPLSPAGYASNSPSSPPACLPAPRPQTGRRRMAEGTSSGSPSSPLLRVSIFQEITSSAKAVSSHQHSKTLARRTTMPLLSTPSSRTYKRQRSGRSSSSDGATSPTLTSFQRVYVGYRPTMILRWEGRQLPLSLPPSSTPPCRSNAMRHVCLV